MNDLTQRYIKLLHNRQQLQQLAAQHSMAHFCDLMARYLDWPDLTEPQMLTFLRQQNARAVVPQSTEFNRCWFPYAYQSNQQSVRWLLANEKPQQPFLADYIAANRQSLLATLIQPYSLLADVLVVATPAKVVPALLIFHWSRTGSTLLASSMIPVAGCLVLSESMLISDVLTDPVWQDRTKELLQLLVHLQSSPWPECSRIIIKTNAWDLQQWRLWQTAFPDAKSLCLIRQPAAVLRSHKREAGRHMVKQHVTVWLDDNCQAEDLITYQQQKLTQLMQLTAQLVKTGNSTLIDYQQLIQLSNRQWRKLTGLPLNDSDIMTWQQHLKWDAKNNGQLYRPAEPVTSDCSPELAQQYHSLRLQCHDWNADELNPLPAV
jgi:hypothetical protein